MRKAYSNTLENNNNGYIEYNKQNTFKRNYYNRRSYGSNNRRSYGPKKTNYYLSNIGLSLFSRKQIKKIILSLSETKYIDQYIPFDFSGLDDYSIYNTGTIIGLCTNIVQGTSVNERIGNQITVTSIEFNYKIGTWEYGNYAYDPTAIGYDAAADVRKQCSFRVILFTWKDDTLPLPTDILESIGDSRVSTPVPILSSLNREKKVKRNLLYDKTSSHFVNALQQPTYVTVNVVCNNNMICKEYIPILRENKVQWTSTGIINNIYALIISDLQPTTPDPETRTEIPWQVYVNYRVNFKDM